MSTDQALVSVVYSSEQARPFDAPGLRKLLTESRAANQEAGITGMLLYRDGRFIQFLEGPARAVRALLQRIRSDERHIDVRVLLDKPIQVRTFDEWTMGFREIDTGGKPPAPGFRSTFDDLRASNDSGLILRAAHELTLWFRFRSEVTSN